MHFRRRGNNVQIVKTLPGEGGKVTSKPVGSANIRTGEITPQAAELLSAAEMQEVKDWIARQTAIAAQRSELEYRCLADTMASVAGWVQTADPALLREHAEDVRDGLNRLRRSLAVALGETRPAGKQPARAAAG